jgi:hypothetical protein
MRRLTFRFLLGFFAGSYGILVDKQGTGASPPPATRT